MARKNGKKPKTMNQKPKQNKALSGTGLIVLFIALACALPIASESPPGGDANITIINPQSYPAVGGSWTVMFNTTGTADLWITAVNGTEFNKDLMFLEVRCGDEILNYELINNSIFIGNYECSETGTGTGKVLTSGKHHLEFKFGLQTHNHNIYYVLKKE